VFICDDGMVALAVIVAGAPGAQDDCLPLFEPTSLHTMTYDKPSVTVDCVVLDSRDRLLLIRRRNPPFAEQFALPGGFVDPGETTEAAARRELAEETGLQARDLRLVGVYSKPGRDPRGWTISIAYLVATGSDAPVAGDDAAEVEFRAGWRELDLAFDHNEIVRDAAKLRSGEDR
jgi:8-oxo-dGTP diphosphatase